MRVSTKFAIDAYKAQRLTKSALTYEQEERLRQHIEETRKILKHDDSRLSFADILQMLLKNTNPAQQH